MSNVYTCEEVEVSIDDLTDVAVYGSIERECVGCDDDGCPLYKDYVTVEAVYAVVMEFYKNQPITTYSEHPMHFIPIAWKGALIQAIWDEAEADAEKAEERRQNG